MEIIAEIKSAKLADVLKVFQRFAVKMDAMEPEEQALVMSLLMRHCQARLGLEMDAPRKGPLPTNPEDAVAFFRKLATQLETMSGADNTLIVNLLLQAWQWRAENEISKIKAMAKEQEKATIQ
jgi:hypothetical protein